jgi:hypothetical protein
MALEVTAELIQVQDEVTGASSTLAKGSPLPSSVKGDQLKHLKELGFVGEPEVATDDKSADEQEDEGSKSSSSRKSSSK